MKTTLLIAFALTAQAAFAHTIKGQAVRRGKAATVTFVNGVEVACEVKFDRDKIKNLLEEDRFGNPAYVVTASILTNSRDRRALPLRETREIRFTNMHTDGGGKIVRDELYVAPTDPRARFTIDGSGNLRTITVPTSVGLVNCAFGA
jgi:hypothetical protein